MASVSRQRRLAKVGRRALRAGPVRNAVKTALGEAQEGIASGEGDSAKAAVVAAIKALDRAVAKGILHPNNAARRKSRLVRKLNQALSSS